MVELLSVFEFLWVCVKVAWYAVLICIAAALIFWLFEDILWMVSKDKNRLQWVDGFERARIIGARESLEMLKRNEFEDDSASYQNGVKDFINLHSGNGK